MTAVPKVYLDSNIFIEAFEQATARADHARWLLDAVESGRLTAATSELTLAELLVKPLQRDAHDLAGAYVTMFEGTAGFEILSVERSILIEAARVRAGRLTIRLPDAIHVATARRSGCACIASGDTRLSTRDGPIALALGPITVDQVLEQALASTR